MENIELDKKVRDWIEMGKKIAPNVCDWIGVYFKESFLLGTHSTDLVLGPFFGEPTEHTRISISKGICGLAIREERSINVADVRSHPDHIACSISTRSELVIPLRDHAGNVIAELDIDCNHLNAFSSDLTTKFEKFADTFADRCLSLPR